MNSKKIMKPLKPSHREHKRYLLISGRDANKKNIEDCILKFTGVLGYARASPMFVKLSTEKQKTGKIVLAINRGELEKVRVSFLLSGKNICIEKVLGTLKKF